MYTQPFFVGFQQAGHLYDPSSFPQNGLATTPLLPASAITPYTRHYSATQPIAGYSVPTQWLPQYIVQPAPHMTQMDVSIQYSLNGVPRNDSRVGEMKSNFKINISIRGEWLSSPWDTP